MNTTTAQATDAELLTALAASPEFVTVEDVNHLAYLLNVDEDEIAPTITTENLADIIDPQMAFWITSEIDAGGSLSAGTLAIPTTEYRRERVTTWIREMGRPAAVTALYAHAARRIRFKF